MAMTSTRFQLLLSIILGGVILSTGCCSGTASSEPEQIANSTVTAEATEQSTASAGAEEAEYSVDLILTVITPENDEYISTDNGVTWSINGAPVSRREVPALLTVLHSDPVSISDGDPFVLTTHTNTVQELLGGYGYNLELFDGTDWKPAEFADKSKKYGILDYGYIIYKALALDSYIPLDLYEPIEGRYRATISLGVSFDGKYTQQPPLEYTFIAEFNALP